MQIETFKVFRDLVETSSFSKAAEANGITQSAVSQQVRAIEEKFRVRLIDRGRREFSLTTEGRTFLRACRSILEAYEDLGQRIRGYQEALDGELRVATVFSIGLHELPPYLSAFRAKHPGVDVRTQYCRSGEVVDAVRTGAAEIGLVAYPSRQTGLKVLTFLRDKLVLVCAPNHPLASQKSIALANLKGAKFVAFEPDLPTRKEIDKRLREQGVRLKPVLEFDNIETVKRAVEIESACSIVPEISVRDEVRAGNLVTVPIRDPDMWRPLGAVVKRGRTPSPAAQEFLSTLENLAAHSQSAQTKEVAAA